MNQRLVSFPEGPDYGTTHFEHGRMWEYVKPGMWKSVAGDIEVDVHWDDIEGKPVPIKNLAGENTAKASIVSGGNY